MIINSNIVGIIADDLTGANDTALQFHLKGANTQILLSDEIEPLNIKILKLGLFLQNQEMLSLSLLMKKY